MKTMATDRFVRRSELPLSSMSKREQMYLIAIAFFALALGVIVYFIDRSPGSVYFIPAWLSQSDSVHRLFGVIGNYLPTFVHPFAFIIFTTVLVKSAQQNLIIICALWFTIDGLFEIAQINVIAQWLVSFTPAFKGIPVLENTHNYFLHGTFDWLDLLSILLGTISAYFVITFSNTKADVNNT